MYKVRSTITKLDRDRTLIQIVSPFLMLTHLSLRVHNISQPTQPRHSITKWQKIFQRSVDWAGIYRSFFLHCSVEWDSVESVVEECKRCYALRSSKTDIYSCFDLWKPQSISLSVDYSMGLYRNSLFIPLFLYFTTIFYLVVGGMNFLYVLQTNGFGQ